MKLLITWTMAALFAVNAVAQTQLTRAQVAERLAKVAKPPPPPVPAPVTVNKAALLKKPKVASMAMAAQTQSQTGGGGGMAMMMQGGEPESVLFDTLSAAPDGWLPSWRDDRAFPAPDGFGLGILIDTNCPFELTAIEVDVTFDDPSAVTNTEFEVAFFRNTNAFRLSLFVSPEAAMSDIEETLPKLLMPLGNGTWRLRVELPTYGWGTSRVLTIRTQPVWEGLPMARMSLSKSAVAVPGVTAYATDNTTTNFTVVALPRMQVWRRMVPPARTAEYLTYGTDFEVSWLPGYQLGSTTNLAEPMVWTTEQPQPGRAVMDSRQGSKFFVTRPDPTH